MQRKIIGKAALFTVTELMLFYNKLDYGFYWFGVCFREWYDTVLMGEYDHDEHPAWEFFNHINYNYPLEYRLGSRGK
jgi:hypothetical protein